MCPDQLHCMRTSIKLLLEHLLGAQKNARHLLIASAKVCLFHRSSKPILQREKLFLLLYLPDPLPFCCCLDACPQTQPPGYIPTIAPCNHRTNSSSRKASARVGASPLQVSFLECDCSAQQRMHRVHLWLCHAGIFFHIVSERWETRTDDSSEEVSDF